MIQSKKTKELVAYLDETLRVDKVPDYEVALNGLQLANGGEVTKIGAAVDASLPVIKKAAKEGVDFLIVHHGLFWQGTRAFVDAQYEKIKIAMDANMAVYSSHIPLDVHPEFGNNKLLCQLIEMTEAKPFHDWKGIKLGLMQELNISLNELLIRLEKTLGAKPHFCNGRSDKRVGNIGVITGGAGSEIETIASEGIDTFITGEGPHWSYPLAEELGVNLIYGGHYATETFGVKCIAQHLADLFLLNASFIHHPTGL